MDFSHLTPKLFSLLRQGISRKQLFNDLTAGIIVGIVALPLAIAFGIASGVSPEKGLVTAVIAGFIISFLGGSRVQIGGPTGAFIVIVYAIVQDYGVGGLTIATFMAGFILIVMGMARFGRLLKYIPYPLIVGFTSGIALIILSSQVKDFFGLPIENVPTNLIDRFGVYAAHMHQVNWISAAIATATVLISVWFHRITKKIPGSLVAILASTVAVSVFELPVATIESLFGDIPGRISMPVVPDLDYSTIKSLIQPAFTIALLGGIESLLSAEVADGMIGGRHRSSMELIAQGTANCFSALFAGIPATGAIARTATNIKNGGRTPIAGMTHAVFLLLVMLFFAPYAKLIPMPCLAGILVVVAYYMSEWTQFRALLKENASDVLILLTTFLLTVIFDLIIALEVGIVLASFTLMKRLSDSFTVSPAANRGQPGAADRMFEEELPDIPKGILIYEISGALFFGATQFFQDTMNRIRENPRVLILRMRNVTFIDATGIMRLKETLSAYNRKNVGIILSGVSEKIKPDLEKADIYAILPRENLLDNIDDSLVRAKRLLADA